MKASINQNVQKYDAWYDNHKAAFMSELAALKKVTPEKGKGLEIGVGTGRFAKALKIRYGIDPSKSMLGLARSRGIKCVVARGEALPFKKNTFDHVLLVTTLCFVRSPRKVLTEAKRVLKPQGKIIVGFIDKESSLGKSYAKKKSAFYRLAKFLSATKVKRLLTHTGFNGLEYVQTLFSNPEKLKRAEKPKQGFGQGSFVVMAAVKP